MHYRTTKYRVYSQDKHISIDGESLTVYNNTSWRQNVTTYLIYCMNIGSFFSYGTCIYTVVYVYYVCFGFGLVEIPAKMGSHVLYCHLLALVFWTGASAVIVLPWCSHRDLSADPGTCLLIPLASLCPYPLSVSLSLSKRCMVLTRPSECSQLTSKSLDAFVTLFSCLSPCVRCKLIFH